MKNLNDNQQHSTPSRYRKQRRKQERRVSALALVCIICCLVSGLTLAYLVTSTEALVNIFGTPSFDTSITESFGDDTSGVKTKENVKITNTGDVDAYVRETVVVTWVNDKGEVYSKIPAEGTDYTITWTTEGTAWEKGKDGYWYYTTPLAPGADTAVLFTDCRPVEGKTPEGYYLTVEILSQSIQAEPADAVIDAWGVTVSNDTIVFEEAGNE